MAAGAAAEFLGRMPTETGVDDGFITGSVRRSRRPLRRCASSPAAPSPTGCGRRSPSRTCTGAPSPTEGPGGLPLLQRGPLPVALPPLRRPGAPCPARGARRAPAALREGADGGVRAAGRSVRDPAGDAGVHPPGGATARWSPSRPRHGPSGAGPSRLGLRLLRDPARLITIAGALDAGRRSSRTIGLRTARTVTSPSRNTAMNQEIQPSRAGARRGAPEAAVRGPAGAGAHAGVPRRASSGRHPPLRRGGGQTGGAGAPSGGRPSSGGRRPVTSPASAPVTAGGRWSRSCRTSSAEPASRPVSTGDDHGRPRGRPSPRRARVIRQDARGHPATEGRTARGDSWAAVHRPGTVLALCRPVLRRTRSHGPPVRTCRHGPGTAPAAACVRIRARYGTGPEMSTPVIGVPARS